MRKILFLPHFFSILLFAAFLFTGSGWSSLQAGRQVSDYTRNMEENILADLTIDHFLGFLKYYELLADPVAHLYPDEQWAAFFRGAPLSTDETDLILPLVSGYGSEFHLPAEGSVMSRFGRRGGRYHYGVDIKVANGAPIVSSFGGVVRASAYNPSYGNTVIVRHYNGLETLYAHLSKRAVSAGDTVSSGQLVGRAGNTGRSTGTHLHFEVRFKGYPIDPCSLIVFEQCRLKDHNLVLDQDWFIRLLNENELPEVMVTLPAEMETGFPVSKDEETC